MYHLGLSHWQQNLGQSRSEHEPFHAEVHLEESILHNHTSSESWRSLRGEEKIYHLRELTENVGEGHAIRSVTRVEHESSTQTSAS